MKHAFEKAGLPPRDNEFLLAIAKYLNSGGTIERCHALVDQVAAKMGKVGQTTVALSQKIDADLPQPTPSKGQACRAQQGHMDPANARPPLPAGQGPPAHQGQNTNANGQPNASGKAKPSAPVRAKFIPPPVREPSEARIAAMEQAKRKAAHSILYRYRTSDRRFWGDVHAYEVGTMMRDSIRGQALLSACGALNDLQMRMTFAELLKPNQAKLAMEKADRELVNVA